MLSDIEIAQQNKMEKIQVIADKCGLTPDDIEQYGHYKAKISFDAIRRLEDKTDGKLVLVTAITPTPAGEGKSTTSIGLVQGLQKIGKNAIATLREPSLGPVFGIKGGAAGVVTLKLYQWMILTFILQVICTLLQQLIIYCPL